MKEKQKASNEELLTKLVKYFEDFQTQSQESRKLCERDRDYADHKQLTESELSTLKRRKQPPTINNRVRKKINWLRGYERTIRTNPKAYPRTPKHEQDAETVTDALRYVSENVQIDTKVSAFWDNYIVEGTGAVEIAVTQDDKRAIDLIYLHWDRLFWDYHSRLLDFSDTRYRGIVLWMDEDNADARWPDAKDIIASAFTGAFDDTFEDKPTKWTDSSRRRIRVCQIYYLEAGVWNLAFFTKAGFLEEPRESPYLDEDGKPQCCIEMQSAYIDREGNRYGEPRFMIEQQDAINKRESKMLHLLSSRQTFGNKRAVPEGVSGPKGELAKADGHVEMNGSSVFGQDFGVIPTGDMANGQFTLLQEAKAEMDQTSVNASQTGTNSQGLSGRAIMAQQNGGNIEITPLVDGKRHWEHRVYRQIWNRIRQYWTAERWIRVTDDENGIKFVGLNKPITVAEAIQQEIGTIPRGFENDPRLQMISRVENNVSEMDVDLILEDAPDTTTIQQEQFDGLINLASAGVVFPPEIYIEASQLRNKEKLTKMIKGEVDDPQAKQAMQQKQAEQQAIMKSQMDKVAAETMDKQASAQKKGVESQQIQVETQQMAIGLR